MKVCLRIGDSLWKISQLFQIPFIILQDSNRALNPDVIKAGEEINIPGFAKIPYTIQKGDTLSKIAAANRLPIDTLLLVNQQITPDELHIGEKIELPRKITEPCFNSKIIFDYKKLADIIEYLKKMYPFITVHSIGESILGKPIQEIRVGSGVKKVHINASFHANEWITSLVAMRLLNSYLLSLTNSAEKRGRDAQRWYQQVELSLVPMVNPDGVDLVLNGPPVKLKDKILRINDGSNEFVHWKANIRGVDLNKQFPANWEIDQRKAPKSPSSRDYPGEAPLTEPEAVAMAELARRNGFHCVLAFHTQGEEFYWGYEGCEPSESAVIAKEFERRSGYKAIRYIDSHGGYKDWFLQEFKRPGFTIEFGRGINPLPLSQFDRILKKAEEIFFTILSL